MTELSSVEFRILRTLRTRRLDGTRELPETAIAEVVYKHEHERAMRNMLLRSCQRAAQRSIWTFAVRSAILPLTQRPHANERGFMWLFRSFLTSRPGSYAQFHSTVTSGESTWLSDRTEVLEIFLDDRSPLGNTRGNGTASSLVSSILMTAPTVIIFWNFCR